MERVADKLFHTDDFTKDETIFYSYTLLKN